VTPARLKIHQGLERHYTASYRDLYHGVLMPNVLLRQAMMAHAGLPMDDEAAVSAQVVVTTKDLPEVSLKTASFPAFLWVMLIGKILKSFRRSILNVVAS